ncbi:hypothetical protein CVT26_005425 [Gymnopilus dilepis]|uniref:Uncharacterized protein n=1 Tax=Gymnopilus dilepis TaxID=231916 RepID=A0A409X692_9AGAR|nr:hypothetical protein CVT26_005425 [Gymnopilus dilepis]
MLKELEKEREKYRCTTLYDSDIYPDNNPSNFAVNQPGGRTCVALHLEEATDLLKKLNDESQLSYAEQSGHQLGRD